MQASLPVVDLYLPRSHRVQGAPSAPVCPPVQRQALCAVLAAADVLPGGHATQVAFRANSPTLHAAGTWWWDIAGGAGGGAGVEVVVAEEEEGDVVGTKEGVIEW